MSKYTKAVEAGLKGLTAVSPGPCPGCTECARLYGFDSVEEFDAAYEAGKVHASEHFSWTSCSICGSTLGGNRTEFHGIDKDGEILHDDDACTDCVVYLANGDEPEGWRRSAQDSGEEE